jgi:hypothetical protein
MIASQIVEYEIKTLKYSCLVSLPVKKWGKYKFTAVFTVFINGPIKQKGVHLKKEFHTNQPTKIHTVHLIQGYLK